MSDLEVLEFLVKYFKKFENKEFTNESLKNYTVRCHYIAYTLDKERKYNLTFDKDILYKDKHIESARNYYGYYKNKEMPYKYFLLGFS